MSENDPLSVSLITSLEALTRQYPAIANRSSPENHLADKTLTATLRGLVGESGQPIRLGAGLDQWLSPAARSVSRDRSVVRAGDAELDPRLMIWSRARQARSVMLTEKERDVLITLSRAPGRTLSRQDLLIRVWGYARDAETHTVETHIYRLRQKIEDDPAKPAYVLTVEGGYRLAD